MKLKNILIELSAVSKYYKNNPEKLVKFDGTPSAAAQDFISYLKNSNEIQKVINKNSELRSKALDALTQKYTKTLKINPKNLKDLIVYEMTWNAKKYYDAYSSSTNPISNIFSNWDKIVSKTREYAEGRVDKANVDKLNEFFSDKDLKEVVRRSALNDVYVNLIVKKMANSVGLTVNAFMEACGEIKRLQSMSYQKMKSDHKAVIKALTVDKGDLPKVIWRGIFFDGAKITDREKFLKKWKEGNKPGVASKKETSWSKSKDTAISFMTDQSKVKDPENGFYVLLRYDNPTYDDVAADLTNFEFSNFYNQREVMLNSSAKSYVVEKLIPYEAVDYSKSSYYKYQQKNIKEPMSGMFGYGKREFLQNIFKASKTNMTNVEKDIVNDIIGMTLGEVNKKYGTGYSSDFVEDAKNTPFSLCKFYTEYSYNISQAANAALENYKTKSYSPDGYTVDEVKYGDEKISIKLRLKTIGIKTALKQAGIDSNEEDSDFYAVINMTHISSSFYRFKFEIDVALKNDSKEKSSSKIKDASTLISNFFIPKFKKNVKKYFEEQSSMSSVQVIMK